VHPRDHLDSIRHHCEEGVALDLDTPTSVGSWEAALRSAGAACAMVDALMAREAPTGFCATRPPGHHAEPDRAMGFCLFGNVAVAARHAMAEHGAERVMVLDWDVHHGNGTHAAFYSDPAVLFVSLHQWPFYPGTGALGEAGSGAGEGFTINLPVPAESGEEEWLGLVEHVVVPAGREFAPELILVSAGFDAHRADPLADCRLETSSFQHLARHMRGLADELRVPAGAVLEGGYDLDSLPESVCAAMEGLQHGGEPRSAEAGPLVSASAEHVARWWPSVGAATA
jgi:acetoin utilization deacetylase AcuC-like enzyme